MNDFLTTKSRGRMPRDIPILATSGIFVYASLSILFERLAQGDGFLSVYLVLAALFAWPAVAVFNRWAWGRKARKIAQVLASAAENHLPMDTLRRLAPLPNFDKKLRHLIAKGYLQNVRLDMETDTMLFTPASREAQKARAVPIKCPNCGAPTSVRQGRLSKCPYCSSPLAAPDQ